MKIKKKTLKEINGLNIFFLECGKRSHKKTDIILFLHGFPELSYSFRHLMLLFAKKGYYCVAPDQRGYGKTTLSKNFKDKIINYSIFNLTKDIYGLIVKLGFKKVNIVKYILILKIFTFLNFLLLFLHWPLHNHKDISYF